MRRLTPLAVLLALAALTVAACGGSDSGDADSGGAEKPTVPAGAVAVVGAETITQQQFDDLYASAVKQGEASGQPAPEKDSEEEKTLRQQVLQSLVQNAEIRQEAEAKGIAVDEKRVQDDITAFKQQCCEGKDKKFET